MSSAFKNLIQSPNSNDQIPENILNSKNFKQMQLDFKKKYNKDLEDNISRNEILNFLDSNSKVNKFDRNLSNKMFNALLTNTESEYITVKYFISNYLTLIDEIEQSKNEYINNKIELENKNEEYKNKINLYKNEKYTNENISENAKFQITFDSVEFNNDINLSNYINEIFYIIVSINNLNENKTENFSLNKTELNSEKNCFEFYNVKKNDYLNIRLFNNNNYQLRNLDIELEKFMKDNIEEIEVELEIPNENEDTTLLSVKSRVIFITSFLNYYQNLLTKNNDEINKINDKLNKINSYYRQLNGLKCFKDNSNINTNTNFSSNVTNKNTANNTNNDIYNNNVNNNYYNNMKNEYVDSNILNNNNNNLLYGDNFDIYNIIKGLSSKLILACLGISLFNMILGKSDMINFLVSLYIVLQIITYNINDKYLLYLFIGSYIYDFFWVIFETNNHLKRADNGLVIFILTLCNIGCKLGFQYFYNKEKK